MSGIVRLTAENVKRLQAVQITPQGNLVVIGGKNGQGKSSCLDAIEYALAGKDALPSKPVRAGAGKARVILELEDLIVTRTFQEDSGNSALVVSTKDGAKYPSPQALLDKLVGSLSFDPLAFTRLKATDQAETLRRLAGLDFSDLATARQMVYDARRVLNQEAKQLEATLASLPAEDAPSEPVSVAALQDELDRRQAHNRGIEEQGRAVARLRRQAEEKRAQVAEIEKAIEAAEEQIKQLTARIVHLEKQLEEHVEAFDSIVTQGKEQAAKQAAMTPADEEEVKTQIRNAEAVNEKVRRAAQRAKLAATLESKQADVKAKNARLDEIDAERTERLAAAAFPVPGLSLEEGYVTFNGIPFEQCSSAEQLRVSLAMGLAMNPALKVILIRDGSLLDDEALATVAEMAREAGAQVWLERVGTGTEVSVVIEDGRVREVAHA